MTTRTSNRFASLDSERDGTGLVGLPEQDGTGIWPERGGTGIRRSLFGLALLALAPLATAQSAPDVWRMSGEMQGSVQISVEKGASVQLSFLAYDEFDQVQVYAGAGSIKGDFARLDIYRAEMNGMGELVKAGTMDLFLGACGADGEMRLKSETDGSGGKSETDGSGNKSETDGSGNKSETDGSGGKSETDGSGNKFVTRVFTLTHPTARCAMKSETDGSGGPGTP